MIHLDFESRSRVNLQNVGATYYSKHSSTNILLFAYAFDNKKIKLHKTFYDKNPPKGLIKRIKRGEKIIAHNAWFEYLMWNNILHKRFGWPYVPIEQFYCTMGLCSRHGLPKKLEAAALALNLKEQKDSVGHAIMMKMCKPRKPTKNNPDEWLFDDKLYKDLGKYCKQDVRTEIALHEKLPEVNPKDLEIWLSSRRSNALGIYCDKKAIENSIELISKAQIEGNKKLQKLTKGKIQKTTQTKVITEYLSKYGIETLAAKRIEEYLEDKKLHKKARKVLLLRQEMTKTSTSKLKRLLERLGEDNRVMDLTLYHGAHTGRDTGVGPQPLNMPRGKLKDHNEVKKAIKAIRKKDLKTLKEFGPILHTISNCARAMFMAPKGSTFICADLNAIEARLNFWFAGEEKVLELYRKNKDLYIEMAAKIYNVSKKKVTDFQRFIGKQVILALGYGMGWKTFINNMKIQFNIDIDIPFAKKVVELYRKTYAKIAGNPRKKVNGVWQKLEKIAKDAVIYPGKTFSYNGVSYTCKNKSLFCKLPSGRYIVYKFPKISWDSYGRMGLTYMSWNSKIGKFIKTNTYGGKLTENVIQAMARDLLVRAILKLEKKGYKIPLSVYDEILTEVKKEKGSLEEVISIMTNRPKWAKGLPLKASGWTGKRYRKD